MKNIYVLTLSAKEDKAYNKFNHLVMKHIEDELSWLDVVNEDFPKMTIRGTETEINTLVELLKADGFEVSIEKASMN